MAGCDYVCHGQVWLEVAGSWSPHHLKWSMVLHDDDTLLAAARRQDSEALAAIHDRYYEPLYRYVIYRVNDPALAEDLTSDVFLRLLDALNSRDGPHNALRGWLYRVAGNLVADHYRQRGKRPMLALDEILSSAQADDMLHGMIARESVRAALSSLTPDQQNVIALRFGWGMTIRETADTMNKSESAIKQLQLRALSAIGRAETQKSLDGKPFRDSG